MTNRHILILVWLKRYRIVSTRAPSKDEVVLSLGDGSGKHVSVGSSCAPVCTVDGVLRAGAEGSVSAAHGLTAILVIVEVPTFVALMPVAEEEVADTDAEVLTMRLGGKSSEGPLNDMGTRHLVDKGID